MNHGTLTLSNITSTIPRLKRGRSPVALLTLGISTLFAMGLSIPSAQAQSYTEQTLHSFKGIGATTDGANPQGSLIYVDINGSEILYGTTVGGGSGYGTIFSINPVTKAVTIVYSFTGTNSDGSSPQAGLTNVNGILYGTTSQGGSNNAGTVFSFNPTTHAEKAIHSFGSHSDGADPVTSLINVNGILYGTTQSGGQNDNGTVFAINPTTNAETTLYSFNPANGIDGGTPVANLLDVNGILYGTTSQGGADNDGAVFSVNTANNAETTVYSFTNENGDGLEPQGGLVAVGNLLYGATYYGGAGYGTIFSVDPSSDTEKVIHTFSGYPTDGANPIDLLSVSGILFGVTYQGGNTGTGGTVFTLNIDGSSFYTLHSFTGYPNDGGTPMGSVIAVGGTLYGTSNWGGTYNDGTVFSITPANATTPVAHNDACTIKYNTARTNAAPGVLANDSSGGCNPMTATLVTNVSHGTLTLNSDGSFAYTPNTGYVGPDSFTYRVSNPIGPGTIGTVTLTVQAVTPIAHNDSCTIRYNTARTNAAPGVLANDFDGGSTPLTASLVSTTSHGKLTLNSDGSFSYTPNTGFAGTDTFTYQPVNAVGPGTIGTVTFTVLATTPTAHNDSCTIAHNKARSSAAPGVLGNDDTGGSTPLTAALVTNVSHGTLTLGSDGSFTYTPNSGYSGTDTFTYRVSNAVGQGTIGTVTLNVQ